MARITAQEAGGARILAFLDTIKVSELGEKLIAASDDGYNVLVGATGAQPLLFGSYHAHPRHMCILHIGEKTVNSSAAGAYQQIMGTWDGQQRALALPDFSPRSQDFAAVNLLRGAGALPHILAGNLFDAIEVAAAIGDASPIWASLPGSKSGQPQHAMDMIARIYGAQLAKYETLAQAVH
jgi:muramidase (phage lysozyme)